MINALLAVGVLEVNFLRNELNEDRYSGILYLCEIQKMGSIAI